ncbi:MAG TPA: hypothetical protein VGF73_08360 [Chthoniobacterales bacterium]
MKNILQILPRPPGSRDGVGDYAQTLALRLEECHGLKTTFASVTKDDAIVPANGEERHDFAATILHYVNYGYDRRGIPHWLPRVLEHRSAGKLLTIFHELYAGGTWRQSAFWLRPLQKQIARTIAEISGGAIVSSEPSRLQLARLTTATPIFVHPVLSNFGEPDLASADFTARDPHRWVICGGSALLERSLRSFPAVLQLLDGPFAPRELFVFGGTNERRIRDLLPVRDGVTTHYHPEIEIEAASEILAGSAFGWIDYFSSAEVPTAAILKSTAFAAFCAHGVIPILPHQGSSISLGDDVLPGPFFIAPNEEQLPTSSERGLIAASIYKWYQRHASSSHLAAAVAAALLP